ASSVKGSDQDGGGWFPDFAGDRRRTPGSVHHDDAESRSPDRAPADHEGPGDAPLGYVQQTGDGHDGANGEIRFHSDLFAGGNEFGHDDARPTASGRNGWRRPGTKRRASDGTRVR